MVLLTQLLREFRGKVKALLNDEQYRAFEEFSRQGMEWQWKTDIALLMEGSDR